MTVTVCAAKGPAITQKQAQPRRLKPCQALFGRPGVQATVGVIDGNQGIHVWSHVGQQEKLREGISERPDARERFASVHLIGGLELEPIGTKTRS